MRNEFEEFDDYNDEELVEIERPLIDDMDLLRLSQCANSTKRGFIDQGFPVTMKRLSALNFVIQVGKGYKVTNEGFLYLEKYKKKLETI